MALISIIPGFQPKNDDRLLAKAEALRPALFRTLLPAPVSCRINGRAVSAEEMRYQPLKRGDQAVLDFGRHVVGRLSLKLDCTGSHQDAPAYLRIDLAEIPAELEEKPENYDGWLSRSWIQQEHIHADALPATLDLPRRYAFRYARLTVLDTSPKYQLLLTGASCVAETSADSGAVSVPPLPDDELRRIYETSLRTLAECTQEVLEDGPKRDRRLWMGDLRLQALAGYASFRSLNLIKRCLYLFAGTRFPDGRMSANVFTDGAPAADDTYLMDYALIALPALEEYLEESGDREALQDLLEPFLEQADYVISHFLSADGVISADAAALGFIDWCDGLHRAAALTGVLICALDAAAALCQRSGDAARQRYYLDRAASLRSAAQAVFWDGAQGCFLSGGQISIHSQIWLTLAGAMPEGRAVAAMDHALAHPGSPRMATPYMHHYYVMALLKAGQKNLAEAHIRAYWGGMLRAGADTFWECFDPDDPKASPYGGLIVNSFCHAWSCTPAYILHRYFLNE